jgi:hypothetical protein
MNGDQNDDGEDANERPMNRIVSRALEQPIGEGDASPPRFRQVLTVLK